MALDLITTPDLSHFENMNRRDLRRILNEIVTEVNNNPTDLSTATYTVEADDHGNTLLLNRAAGVTATLPAATGTGNKFRFFVQTTVTSNSYKIQVANATDVMAGNALLAQDAGDTAVMFEAEATADTITLNGTTTGGLKGAFVEVEDVAAGLFAVHVVSAATGTEATPFSAAVS